MCLDSPYRGKNNQQCPHTQTPVHCKLCHATLLERIDSPSKRSTSRLEGLVGTNEDGSTGRAVRLGSDQPVAEALPQCVVHSVEDVQEDGTRGNLGIGVVEVLLVAVCKTVIRPLLERIASAPSHHTRDDEDSPSDACPRLALEPGHIEDEANDETTQHLSHPVESTVQRPAPDVERVAVDVVLLVGVEDVGAEKEGQHTQDTPFEDGLHGNLDRSLYAMSLSLSGGVELREADALGVADENAQEPPEYHDDHEGNIGRVGHGTALGVEVEPKRRQRANTASEVENDPKYGNGSALLFFRDVGCHDGPLNNPDKRSADTQDCASCNDKRPVCSMVEAEQRAAVQAVRPATDEETNSRARVREDRADEEEGCGRGCREKSHRRIRGDG